MSTYRLTVNNGKQTLFTETYSLPNRELMIKEMIKKYADFFDENYFPVTDLDSNLNETGILTEVKDCDGQTIWNEGESIIGLGDKESFFDSITTEEYEEEK